MSNFVKCFDVVSMVVDEATDQFSQLWKINKERYEILKQYCDVLDSLVEEFDGESFNVEVDDISMNNRNYNGISQKSQLNLKITNIIALRSVQCLLAFLCLITDFSALNLYYRVSGKKFDLGGDWMNRTRRELLNRAKILLDQASELISTALDQEQDCLDNMPENL